MCNSLMFYNNPLDSLQLLFYINYMGSAVRSIKQEINMANVTIDRCENVIVNRDGRAHTTGWVIAEAFKVGGAPRLMRGKGNLNPSRWPQFWVDKEGDTEIPVTVPLSVAEFERLTGWTPEA